MGPSPRSSKAVSRQVLKMFGADMLSLAFPLIPARALGRPSTSHTPLAVWLSPSDLVLSSSYSRLSLMDFGFSQHCEFAYSIQPPLGKVFLYLYALKILLLLGKHVLPLQNH